MMKKKFAYRTKLIIFILFIILLIFLAGTYNSVSFRQLFSETRQLMLLSQQLTVIYDQIKTVQEDMEVYLFTRNSEDLAKFYDSSNMVSTLNQSLKKAEGYTERGIKIKNLTSMVERYLKGLDDTVFDKRNENVDKYMKGAEQVAKENAYIESYVQQIMSEDLRNNAARYNALEDAIEKNNMLNNMMLLLVLTIAVMGTFLFGYQITKPISQLANYAKLISEGDYTLHIEENNSSLEMHSLYSTFGQMAKNVQKHVDEIQEHQQLEKKLAKAEIDSLKMESSLREAELHALQYQMNPHFIFNTINIGAKIAMLQGDQVTCDYLENTASVFRYNLRSMDMDVTLEEELQNAQDYLLLLATRFGDVLKFRVDMPEGERERKLKMPPLILQPLVENAYIHGISKQENGGEIRVSVTNTATSVNVNISNTGPPIPMEKVTEIMDETYDESQKANRKGHTTNIGIGNVLRRLRLYFGTKDVMNIICGGGRTNVILKLPYNAKHEKG